MNDQTNTSGSPKTQDSVYLLRAKAAIEKRDKLWTKLMEFEKEIKPQTDQLRVMTSEWFEAKQQAEVLWAMAMELEGFEKAK